MCEEHFTIHHGILGECSKISSCDDSEYDARAYALGMNPIIDDWVLQMGALSQEEQVEKYGLCMSVILRSLFTIYDNYGQTPPTLRKVLPPEECYNIVATAYRIFEKMEISQKEMDANFPDGVVTVIESWLEEKQALIKPSRSSRQNS